MRTEGRADGLTKAQAERVLRRMREIESPRAAPDGQRVTMEQAGQEFCQRLELKGRRKSHRLTVASDLRNHIAPFFAGKTLDRIRPEDIERYVGGEAADARDQDDPQPRQHDALDLRPGPAEGLVPDRTRSSSPTGRR